MLLMVVILLIIPRLFTPNFRANSKPLSHRSGTQHYPGSTLGPASSCPSSSWGRGGGVMTLRVQLTPPSPKHTFPHHTPLSSSPQPLHDACPTLEFKLLDSLFKNGHPLFFPIFTCLLSGFSRVLSLRPHGLQPTRLLCPWDSPGKNTGMGSHALLQGVFLTQGSNPRLFCLRHWQVSSLPLSHLGSPLCSHQNSRSRPQSSCPVSPLPGIPLSRLLLPGAT